MERDIGVLLVVLGVVVLGLGLLVWTGTLSWFGRLPGDLRFEGGSSRVFIPVTSMIVVSLALTVIVNLLARWLR